MGKIVRYTRLLFVLCITYGLLVYMHICAAILIMLYDRKKCSKKLDKCGIFAGKNIRLIHRLIYNTKFKIESNIVLPHDQSHLIIANHKGTSDCITTALLFRNNAIRFIAKESLAKTIPITGIPFYSIFLRLQDHCLINRSRVLDSLKQIKQFTRLHVAEKNNIVIFPEGTRYKQHHLTKEFFSSAIKLILKTAEIPIVVVALGNGDKVDALINYKANSTLRAKILGIFHLKKTDNLVERVNFFRQLIDDQLQLWKEEDDRETSS